MFELIKKYYRMGIYTDKDLETFVGAGQLTREQADEIREAK
ncbi:XkdX family protein [Angelakisella massiliensis]|nr:XkdX family protein [Angelakisella massiliensis]